MTEFKLRGTTDEITVCDACGKKNLKLTVILEPNDSGEAVYYGTDCAAQALLGSKSARNRKIIGQRARAIQFCRDRVAGGADLKTAADDTWNRFGFPCWVNRHGDLLLAVEEQPTVIARAA